VSAHGVAGQIDTGRVVLERGLGEFEHFHGVHASEVFPVEPEGPPVGRRDDVEPAFGGIGSALAEALHAGAVAGQDDGRRRFVGRDTDGGPQAIVLHAAVDLADESDLSRLRRLDDLEFQRHAVAKTAVGSMQFERSFEWPALGRGGSLDSKSHFANAQTGNRGHRGGSLGHAGRFQHQGQSLCRL